MRRMKMAATKSVSRPSPREASRPTLSQFDLDRLLFHRRWPIMGEHQEATQTQGVFGLVLGLRLQDFHSVAFSTEYLNGWMSVCAFGRVFD